MKFEKIFSEDLLTERNGNIDTDKLKKTTYKKSSSSRKLHFCCFQKKEVPGGKIGLHPLIQAKDVFLPLAYALNGVVKNRST